MKLWHWIALGVGAFVVWDATKSKASTSSPSKPGNTVHDLFVNHPDSYPGTVRIGDGLTISGAVPWSPNATNGFYVNRSPIAALTEIGEPGTGVYKFTSEGQVTVVWGAGAWGGPGQAIINVVA